MQSKGNCISWLINLIAVRNLDWSAGMATLLTRISLPGVLNKA